MANMVLMPQMGVSEESAILAQWLVKEGDTVKPGMALFSLETGKSAFECLCEVEGTVLKFFASEGEEINVGVPVCAIGAQGEQVAVPDAKKTSSDDSTPAAPVAEESTAKQTATVEPSCTVPQNSEFKASPRAKKLAEETGMNLTSANPTGPEGRIIERDVRTLLQKGPANVATPCAEAKKSSVAPGEPVLDSVFEEKPLSKIRKIIAENMHRSLSEMAQLTLNRTFDATAIMEFRKQAKESQGFGVEHLTINDFILFAVAKTLLEFPEINAHFLGDKMRYFKTVNLGVAVDTPRGLMVPVIRDAQKMSLLELSKAVRAKASLCREGNIPPEELSGGTFTISNLGASGIESFTPIINPPQTAILGVDTFTLRPKEVNGEIRFYKAMGLSLTFDHRAVDGAPAAAFLKAVSEKLEHFNLLLAI